MIGLSRLISAAALASSATQLAIRVFALLGGFFQRVGQVDAQPLVGAETVARFLQLHPELQVGDRIRGHEQLKTENAVQEVLGDVVVPRPGLLGELPVNLVDDEV